MEIPLIQRDYAQGRTGSLVETIRHDFLDALIEAIAGGEPLDLDFVYGEIEESTLKPLDGQQRLTTLFLLHWYVAARTDRLSAAAELLKLTYATRPTAELFCRQLVNPQHPLTDDFTTPSEWITNQAWYLFSWRHDPTVQAMLVMLDAIHNRLGRARVDLDDVWSRLTDKDSPAISFYFLPIDDMPSGDELYIKMNSRGKPLTDFENFKARFEKLLAGGADIERFERIIHKIDGVWTDVLWQFDGGDDIIDDEFLRYFEFVVEVCEWRDGEPTQSATLLERAERAFGLANPRREPHLDFLEHAFDTWVDVDDVGAAFAAVFTDADSAVNAAEHGKVPLFDAADTNLFTSCLRTYGIKRGRGRQFSLAETLFLLAVLVHRQYRTDEFAQRVRVLRNLIDLADDELREARMTDLVPAVERLIRDGSLDELRGFNPDRLRDEQAKQSFVGGELELVIHRLEDHPLLRGRIFAFDLEPSTLPSRADAFVRVTEPDAWGLLTAALLAKGDYGFDLGSGRVRQFGTRAANQASRWREVFSHSGRGRNGALRTALGALLDEVAASNDPALGSLERVAAEFVTSRRASGRLDWRYYMVAYPAMREGATGIYYGEHRSTRGVWGYSMCMLRTASLTGSAYYRDPYLLSIYRTSALVDRINDPWFRGYETSPRWLRLSRSGSGIRCVEEGFELAAPQDADAASRFSAVCEAHGGTVGGFLPIRQLEDNGELIDAEDRVVKGAALVRALVEVGL
ncbi:DUF262 domain-containing protein [Agromyces humi]|uniref:DUF262 domain-containing protein n=1 Tax=Agromyces humi TaxID=1766800 RepID=UPI001359FC7B|nr:DUF262 domain-containing protein [Agromyces humi]